jgi:hypothetical protein
LDQHPADLEATMNAALKICQLNYDAQLPPAVSEQDDQREWLESAAEQLVGHSPKWTRAIGEGRGEASSVRRERIAAPGQARHPAEA